MMSYNGCKLVPNVLNGDFFDVFYVQVLCVPYFIILLRIIEGSKANSCSTCIILTLHVL